MTPVKLRGKRISVPALALVAGLLMATTLAGCSGDPVAAPDSSAQDDHHDHGDGSAVEGSGEFEVGLGGAVSLTGVADAAEFEVTYAVTAVDTADQDDQGKGPAQNDEFVVADVEVRGFRGSHTPGIDNAEYTFCLIDGEGNEYHQSPQVIAPELAGAVAADQTLNGKVLFDVPAEALEGSKIRLVALSANGSDLTIFWTY